jgi:hypothetical protein
MTMRNFQNDVTTFQVALTNLLMLLDMHLSNGKLSTYETPAIFIPFACHSPSNWVFDLMVYLR